MYESTGFVSPFVSMDLETATLPALSVGASLAGWSLWEVQTIVRREGGVWQQSKVSLLQCNREFIVSWSAA